MQYYIEENLKHTFRFSKKILILRMFAAHPDTMQYFPQFEGLNSPEEQKKSEVFQEHSEKVKTENL